MRQTHDLFQLTHGRLGGISVVFALLGGATNKLPPTFRACWQRAIPFQHTRVLARQRPQEEILRVGDRGTLNLLWGYAVTLNVQYLAPLATWDKADYFGIFPMDSHEPLL